VKRWVMASALSSCSNANASGYSSAFTLGAWVAAAVMTAPP
jgi:hypothetical protein